MVKAPNSKKALSRRHSKPYDRLQSRASQANAASPTLTPANRSRAELAATPEVGFPEALPGTSSASHQFQIGIGNARPRQLPELSKLSPFLDFEEGSNKEINLNAMNFPKDENENLEHFRSGAWNQNEQKWNLNQNAAQPSAAGANDESSSDCSSTTWPASEAEWVVEDSAEDVLDIM